MKVLFLIKSEKTPSSRIRVRDLMPVLEENGIQVDVKEIPVNFSEKKKLFRKTAEYSITILQKRLLNWFEFNTLRRSSKFLTFDFDDAIYCKNASPSEKLKDYKSSTRERLFKRTVKGCDMIIAANKVLAGKVIEYAPEKLVEIIPSSVDAENAVLKTDYSLSEPVVLGWVGTKSTLRYLNCIAESLREISSRHKIILRIIADDSIEISGVSIDFVPWTLETQKTEIPKFDIGLMPLSEDPFSKGKAAYKLLQYMAAGVPSICSPVGMNADVAGNNEHALKAESFSDFSTQIQTLIENNELRERLGKSARNLVLGNYSRKVVGKKLAEIIINTKHTKE